MDEHGIKTMKLYHQVERVFNELTALGIGQSDPVDVELLSQFDQYHYFGTAAVDEGVRRGGGNSEGNGCREASLFSSSVPGRRP